jgi:RimJ/RimL family protein N-acetyltransferase
VVVIETERLLLRTWKTEDAHEYYRINQDPNVLEFLLGPLTMEQVCDWIEFRNQQFSEIGYTLWAVEEKCSGTLMGFIGMQPVPWKTPLGSWIEIGWRLGAAYWGKGYATEGAKAALAYGFDVVALTEIVSFAVPTNKRSMRVMEKIGMQRDMAGDFAHPKLPANHRLSQHVLYRINNHTKKKIVEE